MAIGAAKAAIAWYVTYKNLGKLYNSHCFIGYNSQARSPWVAVLDLCDVLRH